MTEPTVYVIIKPFTLRFSLQEGVPVYHTAADARSQLDQMEVLLGIDPSQNVIFDCNLGFLPICSTVLIQAEKTIVVDPGNFHIGFYGMIGRALERFGVQVENVDMVILTHSHSDHMASTFAFTNSQLVVGEGELESARQTSWPEFVDAFTTHRVRDIRTIPSGMGASELCEGVSVVHTPGHSQGSLCVLVDGGDRRTAILGDTAMTKEEYEERSLSHWYPAEARDGINRALDRVVAWGPTDVIPGHDVAFRVQQTT